MAATPSGPRRPVRSYVLRSGRRTAAQDRAIRRHWRRHGVDFEGAALDPDRLFPSPGALTVEIGFGAGEFLLAAALADPGRRFIGIDVHRPGIGRTLDAIERAGLENVKLVCHDAAEVMADGFAEGAIDRIEILFPDPWPKKRHHKRRLIQPAFADVLAGRLKTGGELHLATDWTGYALHMLEVLDACPRLANAAGAGQFLPAPARPRTRFERRGRGLGHEVRDLLYVRR